jgi:hypothetical protein
MPVPGGAPQDARGIGQHIEERLQRGESASVRVGLGGDQPVVKVHLKGLYG